MSRFGCHFGRFWRRKWSQKIMGARFVWVFLGVQKCSSFLSCFGSPPRRPKRVQEAPKRPQEASRSAPRGPKRPPRALQEAPRGPQETPRAGEEGSKPAQDLPRPLKTLPRRPQGFSEAPGPAAVCEQIKKFKAAPQEAPRGSRPPN